MPQLIRKACEMNFAKLHTAYLNDFKEATKNPNVDDATLGNHFKMAVKFKAKAQDLSVVEAMLQTANVIRRWATPADKMPPRENEPHAADALRNVSEVFAWAGRATAANESIKSKKAGVGIAHGVTDLGLPIEVHPINDQRDVSFIRAIA